MNSKYPFVSVVVPAYNEALMLPSCLEALKEQVYKGKYEIIVVDNNSTDLTPKIAKIYRARVIKEKRRGVSFARQAGFNAARGEFILSTDADTIVPPNWITKYVDGFSKNSDVVAIGGICDLIGINSPVKLISKLLTPLFFLADKLLNYPGSLCGWNFAVSKKYFLKVGGFDLTLNPNDPGEDTALENKLRKVGKTKVISTIKVKTSARRFVGAAKTIKYAFGNFLHRTIKKMPQRETFFPIREKSYESFDTLNAAPLFLLLIFTCLTIIMLLAGAIPSLNIWSTSSVKTTDKVIALTFDNALDSGNTQQILNILNDEKINATFFVTGEEAIKNPKLIKDIYDRKNIIGNQSLSNDPKVMLKTSKSITKNVDDAETLINNIINQKPRFFRPPYGYRSVWGAFTLDNHGYEIITWYVSTNHFSPKDDSKKIAIYLIKNAKQGGIIDININGSESIKATGEVIELLQADGYKFVTLDTLLKKPAYF